jgi:hypothetical protein
MSEPRFQVWFGSVQASADDLARIEEIEVTQEMDRYWEARMRMSMCLDAQGRWKHRPDNTATAFARVRIELNPGNGRFVPLIDGPVSNFESVLDSQPGRSTATFAVRDDSVFLNRNEGTAVFRDQTDSAIARSVLLDGPHIVDARIDDTTATHPITTRRGTPLLFLSELARVNQRHVFVLPGATPGSSIGCFLRDPPHASPDLPPLLLIGDERHLANATIEEDSESPERSRGSTLRISDGVLASAEVSATDIGVGGDRPAVPSDLAALRLLPPAQALREDPADAAGARAHEAGYAYKLSSSVIPGCYAAVLTPYLKVRVECGDTPYSGEYLLTKVVHRITPSLWTQSFEAKSDAHTQLHETSVAEDPGGGLSVSFSAAVGVF